MRKTEFRTAGDVQFSSVHFSPLIDRVVGGHGGRFSRDSLLVFSAGGHCEQFWHGQKYPLFNAVHPVFPLPTTASPILQGALKDGFGEAVVACGMPKPCKLGSLDSCRGYFCGLTRELILLCTQSLVLCSKQDMRRRFLGHLILKAWICFLFRVSKQSLYFTPQWRTAMHAKLYPDLVQG